MTKTRRNKPSAIALGVLIGVLLGVPAIGQGSAAGAATMPAKAVSARTAPAGAHKAAHNRALQKRSVKSVVRRSKVATRKVRASRPGVGAPRVRAMSVGSSKIKHAAGKPASTKPVARGLRQVAASVSVLPSVELRDGQDASFDFEANDGLGFSNWAGEGADASVDMLVKMFGAESVCDNGFAEGCVARHGAEDFLASFNDQLVYGRCEGMVAVVGMAIEAGRDVGDLAVADVEQEIVYWSLSQVAPRVAGRMEETRKMQPSQLVAEISDRIRAGRTTTLAMFGEGFAHSVLPVAVSQDGTRSEITVWDPNFADELTTIVVDLVDETWSYADAIEVTGNQVTLDRSGAGYLGFVENDLRAGVHSARFAN